MKFMIVHNEMGIIESIRHLIAAPLDSILNCSSGDEAMQVVGEFKPDCVIIDACLPGLCAFEAARRIRTMNQRTQVIFVSNYDEPGYRRAAQDAGAIAYVVKENFSELQIFIATKRLLSSLNIYEKI